MRNPIYHHKRNSHAFALKSLKRSCWKQILRPQMNANKLSFFIHSWLLILTCVWGWIQKICCAAACWNDAGTGGWGRRKHIEPRSGSSCHPASRPVSNTKLRLHQQSESPYTGKEVGRGKLRGGEKWILTSQLVCVCVCVLYFSLNVMTVLMGDWLVCMNHASVCVWPSCVMCVCVCVCACSKVVLVLISMYSVVSLTQVRG